MDKSAIRINHRGTGSQQYLSSMMLGLLALGAAGAREFRRRRKTQEEV